MHTIKISDVVDSIGVEEIELNSVNCPVGRTEVNALCIQAVEQFICTMKEMNTVFPGDVLPDDFSTLLGFSEDELRECNKDSNQTIFDDFADYARLRIYGFIKFITKRALKKTYGLKGYSSEDFNEYLAWE